MKKNAAIKILQRQKETVSEFGKDLIWITITMSHFEAFWGKESNEYKLLDSFNKTGNLYNSLTKDQIELKKEESRKRLIKLLDECMILLEQRGTKQLPEKTIVDGLRDSKLLKWGITIALISFLIGYVFGAFDNPKNVFHRMLSRKIEKVIIDK